jgi:anti-sigma regulatory factor (Ser/Thr protein kinase)
MTSRARRVPEPPPRRVIELLGHDATAPSRARRLVRETLDRWQLGSIAEDAELATSELVTNALLYGLPPVVLELTRSTRTLRLSVSDARPVTDAGVLRVADSRDDESGRGLDIVRSVCNDSGVEETDVVGKSVFASWHVPRPGEPRHRDD